MSENDTPIKPSEVIIPEDNTSEDNIPEDADLVLTTIDNPHNPKQDYHKWKQWDEESGYHTESYVARLLMMEEEFDIDNELKTIELSHKVINDILENDPREIYALA